MELYSTYKAKITDKSFNHIFIETVEKYREAVSFFDKVALEHWELFKELGPNKQLRLMEHLHISWRSLMKRRERSSLHLRTSLQTAISPFAFLSQ